MVDHSFALPFSTWEPLGAESTKINTYTCVLHRKGAIPIAQTQSLDMIPFWRHPMTLPCFAGCKYQVLIDLQSMGLSSKIVPHNRKRWLLLAIYLFTPYHIPWFTFHDISMETSMMSYVIDVHSVLYGISIRLYIYTYNIAAYEVKYIIFIYIQYIVYIFHDIRWYLLVFGKWPFRKSAVSQWLLAEMRPLPSS